MITKDKILELVKKFFEEKNTCISRSFIVIFTYFYSLKFILNEKILLPDIPSDLWESLDLLSKTSGNKKNDAFSILDFDFSNLCLSYANYDYQKEFDKLFKNQHLNFDLLYKINELIDELIDNQLLEVSLYPPKYIILDSNVRYIATIGKYNQYFEIDKEENIYKLILRRSEYTKGYCERKRLTLLNKYKMLEKIETIVRFRDYWISRARWSDIEGNSTLEVQFFKSYIVLMEFFNNHNKVNSGFYVGVVKKDIYNENPSYDYYLPGAPMGQMGQMKERIGHDQTEFSKKLAQKIFHYYSSECCQSFSDLNDPDVICKPEELIEIHEQAHLELNDNLFSD